MNIPKTFKTKIEAAFGNEGTKWLDTLGEKIQTYLKKWELINKGKFENLSYNYVIRVSDQNGIPYILKLGVPNFDFRNEIQTVQLYGGMGCASIVRADPENGVMLLEALVPGHMLSVEKDEELVIREFTDVWKAIRRPLPKEKMIPQITDWATSLQSYLQNNSSNEGPISTEHVLKAQTYFKEIDETSKGLELLHGDLHHENILYSKERGWTAIDPKGVGGDPYFDLTSFLVNHLMEKENPKELLKLRVDRICELLLLDRERFLKAAIAMSTLYACWGLEDGADWRSTYQCTKWLMEWL